MRHHCSFGSWYFAWCLERNALENNDMPTQARRIHWDGYYLVDARLLSLVPRHHPLGCHGYILPFCTAGHALLWQMLLHLMPRLMVLNLDCMSVLNAVCYLAICMHYHWLLLLSLALWAQYVAVLCSKLVLCQYTCFMKPKWPEKYMTSFLQ